MDKIIKLGPLNPWIFFVLCLFFSLLDISFLWGLVAIMVAANYHAMGKIKEEIRFVIICVSIFFGGSIIVGLSIILGWLQVINNRIDIVLNIWNLIMGLFFTLIQLPHYKEWQKNKLKENVKKNKMQEIGDELEIKPRYIRLMYIINWFLVLMTLMVIPLSLNYLFRKLALFEEGGFTKTQWSLIFVFAITTIFIFWWIIKRYVIPKANTIPPFSLAIMLYSMGTLPAGLGLIASISLIISNFTHRGVFSKELLGSVLFVFGALSIYGLLKGNKLLNQILGKEDEKDG